MDDYLLLLLNDIEVSLLNLLRYKIYNKSTNTNVKIFKKYLCVKLSICASVYFLQIFKKKITDAQITIFYSM